MNNIHILDKYREEWLQGNAYIDGMTDTLNGIDARFCDDFDSIVQMEEETSRKILEYLLDCICSASHPMIIDSAVDVISALDRSWLESNIGDAVDNGLDTDDVFVRVGLSELLLSLGFHALKERYDFSVSSTL